jgi:hypothetical protein
MGVFETMLKISLDYQRNWEFTEKSRYDEGSKTLSIEMYSFTYAFTKVNRELYDELLKNYHTYDELGLILIALLENDAEENTGLRNLLKAISTRGKGS